MLLSIVRESWIVLGQMAPYLLLGFLVAGILSVCVPKRFVERHLGGGGMGPVIKAAFLGVPLPLCSCGVIPVAASLRAHGASRGATTSFLLSTPQTGVDSIAVTYALLGPVFALLRPVVALATGLIGGGLVQALDPDDAPAPAAGGTTATAPASAVKERAWQRILRYGFVTLPRDISKTLILGILIAGLVSALIPPAYFGGRLGCGLTSMLAMMAVGIPIYVCATGSVPIAAAFIAKGVCPGAALVFLITGPATNAAAVTTLWKTLGKKSTILYLATVSICALGAGWLLDDLLRRYEVGPVFTQGGHEALGWFHHAAAIVLLAVMAGARWPRAGKSVDGSGTPETDPALRLRISGMTCSHCAERVREALQACAGVSRAAVDLSEQQAAIYGDGIDPEALATAVRALGYEAETETLTPGRPASSAEFRG